MIKKLFLILTLTVPVFAQTPTIPATVFLPPTSGAIGTIVPTNCTNATPIVCTAASHGLSNGDAIWQDGIAGNTNADGFFIVDAVTTNTYTLENYLYFPGVVPAGNGAFASAGNPHPYTTKLLPYQLTAAPRVMLDGPSGTITASVSNTSTKANSSNRFYTQLQSIYTNSSFNTNYTTPGIDCDGSTYGTGMVRYADVALLWEAGGQSNSSYLTVAKWGVDHFEEILCPDSVSGAGTYGFICSTPTAFQCGRDDTTELLHPSEDSFASAVNYSIVYSQLSSGEKSNFADKIFNDNALFRNSNSPSAGGGSGGIAGDPTTSCTPWPASTAWNQSAHYCGWWWYQKHEYDNPWIEAGQEANFSTDYTAGTGYFTGLFPYAGNHGMTHIASATALALALADDDPRARSALTQMMVWFFKWRYPWYLSSWTGITENGSRYQQYVDSQEMPKMAVVIKQAIPGYDISGTYSHNLISQEIYGLLPDGGAGANYANGPGPFTLDAWLDSTGINSNSSISQWAMPILGLTQLYPSDSLVPYEYWMLKTWQSSAFTGASWASYQQPLINQYISYDPTISTSNVTGLTTQYLLKDISYSACQTLWGSQTFVHNWSTPGTPATDTPGCYPNMSFQHAISKSDWTSTATQLWMSASWGSTNLDRAGGGQYGAYHIYRNGYLLGGVGTASNPANPTGSAHDDSSQYGAPLGTDMVIEIGGIDNWNPILSNSNVSANFARWAGTDPYGDSSSRYTYAMIDMTPTYQSSADVTRANRHIIHFKKSGTQDYVVVYDDVALSAGNSISAKLFYYVTGPSGNNTVSVNTGALTVSNTLQNGNGKLLSSFLPVAGSNTIAMTTTSQNVNAIPTPICPSTDGTTCNNSATSYESIAVHLPLNGTSGSMPTLTQPSCTATGGNCTAVQIADSGGPKMAVFARQGATLTALSCTSTASGTIQYLVAGITPGTYAVTIGGSPVSGSPFTVNANDDTIYFEGAAGAVQVGASSSPPPGVAPQLFY